jgi:hypothetical protein
MAEEEKTQQQERQQNGHDGRRTVVRAAALAAASGATALAAKKALSHDSGSSERLTDDKRRQSRGEGSMVSSVAGSAWSSARDSIVPMLESAAGQAGEWLATSGPDLVRESIVPQFIEGFQRAGRSSSDDE